MTRFLPERLARYMAWSARSTASVLFSLSCSWATPALKVMSTFSLPCKKKRVVSSRCSRVMAATPLSTLVSGSTMTNSSPP